LPDDFVPSFRNKGVPVFRSPERALRAMAHTTTYAARLAAAERTREAAVPAVALARTGTWPEYAGKGLLAQLGIPVPPGALVRNLDEARGKARDIGYPLVLKAQAADLPHKSDAGGVVMNITDEAVLQAAWRDLHEKVAKACPGLVLEGVLIERMAAPGGVETVVGGRRDPDWGPVTLAGLGGIWVEALHDVRVMPPDLGPAAIMAELTKLKGAALLQGGRGGAASDVDALADVIAKIGALLHARPEIAEIDINPLRVYPDGVLALDALVVVSTSSLP
jgi:acyl-CoA synthetase (NDP forming)